MRQYDFTPEEIKECGERILSAFSLARKAGKCVLGTNMCIEEIRKETAVIVAAANNLSANTVKKLSDSCSYHNVNLIFLDCDMLKLGQRLGKKGGASCAAITDVGFAGIVDKIYAEIHTELTEVQ